MNEHILLVEDDAALRSALDMRLRSEGYVLDTAVDGEEALRKATTLPFDVIVLDVMLPILNGFDVCRGVRQQGMATPILMLTVRDQLVDKVIGLNLGADDYVTKPFESAELIARIQALLRRVPMRAGHGVRKFGPIQVDISRGEVTKDERPVDLTRREFQLLCYLMERPGAAIPRSELLRSVWGYDSGTFTRTVDTHIGSLRRKLEEDPAQPQFILTVLNVGYKFRGTDD
jgi:DNA-binding response OmpR family regulator